MSGKKRPVIVWVDDDRVTDLSVEHLYISGDGGTEDFIHSEIVPVPLDDQATYDLFEAIAIVDMSEWSHRHELVTRLREWAGMDEGRGDE